MRKTSYTKSSLFPEAEKHHLWFQLYLSCQEPGRKWKTMLMLIFSCSPWLFDKKKVCLRFSIGPIRSQVAKKSTGLQRCSIALFYHRRLSLCVLRHGCDAGKVPGFVAPGRRRGANIGQHAMCSQIHPGNRGKTWRASRTQRDWYCLVHLLGELSIANPPPSSMCMYMDINRNGEGSRRSSFRSL